MIPSWRGHAFLQWSLCLMIIFIQQAHREQFLSFNTYFLVSLWKNRKLYWSRYRWRKLGHVWFYSIRSHNALFCDSRPLIIWKRKADSKLWQEKAAKMASNTTRGILVLFLCLCYVSFLLTKPIKKETEPPKENDPKKQEEAEYLRYLGQVSMNDFRYSGYWAPFCWRRSSEVSTSRYL